MLDGLRAKCRHEIPGEDFLDTMNDIDLIVRTRWAEADYFGFFRVGDAEWDDDLGSDPRRLIIRAVKNDAFFGEPLGIAGYIFCCYGTDKEP